MQNELTAGNLSIATAAMATARTEMDELVGHVTTKVDSGDVRTIVFAMVDLEGKITTGGVSVIGQAEMLGALSHAQAVISYHEI